MGFLYVVAVMLLYWFCHISQPYLEETQGRDIWTAKLLTGREEGWDLGLK